MEDSGFTEVLMSFFKVYSITFSITFFLGLILYAFRHQEDATIILGIPNPFGRKKRIAKKISDQLLGVNEKNNFYWMKDIVDIAVKSGITIYKFNGLISKK